MLVGGWGSNGLVWFGGEVNWNTKQVNRHGLEVNKNEPGVN